MVWQKEVYHNQEMAKVKNNKNIFIRDSRRIKSRIESRIKNRIEDRK